MHCSFMCNAGDDCVLGIGVVTIALIALSATGGRGFPSLSLVLLVFDTP